MNRIICGDVLEWAKAYDGPKFHALLCDPPYHLSRPSLGGPSGQYADGKGVRPDATGFMGKKWDGGDIAYRPETWVALAEHLLPGAFGMAFASSRGWHRLACAIEDAGLIIHPSIFGWCYGSGFPKATRIDTQIDKAAGIEREVIGSADSRSRYDGASRLATSKRSVGFGSIADKAAHTITAPATDLARAWVGHRYGLQAMKPALEPIILFQKPYIGKPIECITETGAGALNIDGARIDYQDSNDMAGATPQGECTARSGRLAERAQGGGQRSSFERPDQKGRWPANFYLDEEAARRLGKQSGELKSGTNCIRRQEGHFLEHGGLGKAGDEQVTYGDSGSPARFFFNVDWQLEQADPVFYCAKASRKERDRGLEGTFKAAGCYGEFAARVENGVATNPRTNSPRRNPHPTVKPLKLTQWLATLLLPPKEYAPRRILVPFAGSGSEMIGAALAGWEEIVGVDKEAEYVEIAEARLEYWTKRPKQLRLGE